MILRKPYAFLIKNFKLLHAIMSFFMLYIAYRTLNVLKTFNDYFASGTALIGADTSSTTYVGMMFVLPIIIVLISIILLWVMLTKKKPSGLYAITPIIYIFLLVMFFMGRSTLLKMEANVLDIRLIKMIRDLTTISLITQIYPVVKSLVRAVGFDIKEFDFGKDLQELEIEESDSEEFEVNVSVDTNNLKRYINKRIRKFKYAYKENKVLMNIIMAVIVLSISGIVCYDYFIKEKKYDMNTTFQVSNFNFSVLNAYSTRLDYEGKVLTGLADDTTVIVIPFKVKNTSSLEKSFFPSNVSLTVNGYNFKNDLTYRDLVSDLGTIYNGENIPGKETTYKTFIFKVPTSYLKKDMYLKFITSLSNKGNSIVPTYVKVPIKPTDLDIVKNKKEIVQNEEFDFKSSVLKGTVLNIENVEISKRFKVDYTYNLSNESIPSYEYVQAHLQTNYDRDLIKITYSLNLDDSVNFSDIYDIVGKYGIIRYTIDGVDKTFDGLVKVNPKSIRLVKSLFVAVPKEIEDASDISLELKVRNIIYTYKIKES